MLGLSERWSGVIQDTASTARSSRWCARASARPTTPPRAAACRARRAAHGLRLVAGAQLGGEGRAARGLRPREPAHDPGRRRTSTCDADALAARDRRRIAPPAASPAPSSPPAARTATTAFDPIAAIAQIARARGAVAARRRGDGGLGDDPAGVPRLVGRRRRRRFAGGEPAQVVRRVDRLLHLLRARSAVPGARDVDQPELPADRGRRRR